MTGCGKRGKAEIRDGHQHEADEHRSFHPELCIEDPADEHTNQQRDEADADVVKRDFVVCESEILEQQPQRQVRERVANLVDQDEDQDDDGALALDELGKRTEIRNEGLNRAARDGGLAMPHRLAHGDADEHRRQRKQRTCGIRGGPSVARGDDERDGACPAAPILHRTDTYPSRHQAGVARAARCDTRR